MILDDADAVVLLKNGGNEGDFQVVVKGYDKDRNLTGVEAIEFKGVKKNSIQRSECFAGYFLSEITAELRSD